MTQYAPMLRDLRVFALVTLLHAWRVDKPVRADADLQTWKVAAALFEDLHALHLSRGSTLILVYLPTSRDHVPGLVDVWCEGVRELARAGGIGFVDLVEPFRRVPLAEVDGMFIPEGRLDYPRAAGHYTVTGNAWIAQSLSAHLVPLLGPGAESGSVARPDRARAKRTADSERR